MPTPPPSPGRRAVVIALVAVVVLVPYLSGLGFRDRPWRLPQGGDLVVTLIGLAMTLAGLLAVPRLVAADRRRRRECGPLPDGATHERGLLRLPRDVGLAARRGRPVPPEWSVAAQHWLHQRIRSFGGGAAAVAVTVGGQLAMAGLLGYLTPGQALVLVPAYLAIVLVPTVLAALLVRAYRRLHGAAPVVPGVGA